MSALRFNPRSSSDEGRIHILQAHPQECGQQILLPSECVWDARWRIEDSLLAALLQMLRLEGGRTASECIIAQGHRLPREICLDLPFSDPDPSAVQVRALLSALVHRLADTFKVEIPSSFFLQCSSGIIFRIVQELGVDVLLPETAEFGCGSKSDVNRLWAPACALTEGEFSAADLDGPGSLYK